MAHPLLSLLLAAMAAVAPATVSAQQNMTDAEALMQLKKSFTNSSSLSSWLITSKDGDKSPCSPGSHEWHGVVCGRGGAVTGLRLNGLHLGGTIDVDALAAFRRLRSVSFSSNNFSGNLPAIDRLTALKSMYLSDNQFTGVLPDEFFGKLNHLKKLWLDGNDLSGEIPASITQATSLLELRLERNAFSGELPPLPPPALKVFDISHNDLDGVVPESFRKFDAGKFSGNRFLCYVPTSNGPCTRVDDAATSSSSKNLATAFAAVFVSAVVITLALRLCCTSKSSRVTDLDSFRHDADERPPVYMLKQASSTTGKRSASWLGRRTGSSLGGGGHRRATSAAKADEINGGGGGDLVIVNNCKGVFGLTDLMKAAAEVIGTGGGLGSAYKAVMSNGVAVVVKRARDMNRGTRETFEAEMKRLGATRHANLLPPLAYHYRRDEKLLVYEYIPKGSLLYVLHGDRGMDYAALDWSTRLKVAAGVARGTAFLHAAALSSHNVAVPPHGNLKSANILLAPDFEPLLVDFGYSGLVTHDPHSSAHSMFAHRAPECVAGGAHLAGAKADVYCFGVVLLELLTGKFPSQYLHNAKGGTDLVMWATTAIADGYERDLFDPAIMAAWKFALPDMVRLMHVAVDCVEVDVDKRPGMKEAAVRVEEVVAAAMATVREKQQAAGDGGGSRSSHAQYVRDGSMQRITSVGERSSRRGSNDYKYGIS
uniref:Protein kinase domain-containing protein n=1 Tax=Leersia perrieri TaxID=77586 RepID=A0A0D9WMY3_9ORYZ